MYRWRQQRFARAKMDGAGLKMEIYLTSQESKSNKLVRDAYGILKLMFHRYIEHAVRVTVCGAQFSNFSD